MSIDAMTIAYSTKGWECMQLKPEVGGRLSLPEKGKTKLDFFIKIVYTLL
jgi:hypothetical protein